MRTCRHCGAETTTPFECQYCGGQYCPDHRLPEAHDCDGVRFLSAPGKRFETRHGEVVTDAAGIDPPEPITPEYTVGTTPEYEGAPSPDTQLKADATPDDSPGWLTRLWRWLIP